jgi:ATP-dependent RNA helicase DDX52/ROK1
LHPFAYAEPPLASAGAPAGGPAPPPPAAKPTRPAKRRRGEEAAADDGAGGFSLFGGGGDAGEAREAPGNAAALSAFVREAAVATRDPFEEANVIRKAHRIRVSGSAPPPPLRSFAELQTLYGAPPRLLANLAAGGFLEPTPIQRQAAPALLAGRELLAVAPTGSGKTLAFLLPLAMAARAAARAHPDQPGIKALVLSPTKELSIQSARVLAPLLPGLRLRLSVLSKSTAAGTDFSRVDVLLAQPLRLGAMAREGRVDLAGVRHLVLDEADKLFDMGFAEQVDAVVAACCHPSVVRGLFSATLPEGVEALARSVLRDPLRVTVGERGAAAAGVAQRLLFVGREAGKLLALRQLLSGGLRPPVLVFVGTKDRARELHRELMYDGVHVDSLHAGQSQAARQAAVDGFRLGRTWVLVATDLVGRGMDFAGVNTVVNFDFPGSTTDYVHRVGRTGRAGRAGEAVTFFTEDDGGRLRAVANVMRAAGCEVPPWMLTLKKEHNRKRAPAGAAAAGVSTAPVQDWPKGKGKGKGGGGGGGGGERRQGGDGGGAKKRKQGGAS